MNTKEKIIEILENNRGKTVSGQELANVLNISRAAIWKSIKSIKNDGYTILATQNKGYILRKDTDVLSVQGIHMFLSEKFKNVEIEILKTIDSTNSESKRQIANNLSTTKIIVSNEQTAGRGRCGKSFFSGKDLGIYMSVVIPMHKKFEDLTHLTVCAANALCRAINSVQNEKAQIKWVNDIFLNKHKVCGILTEAISDFESGTVEAVIIGIGINFKANYNDFPEEIRSIAGAVNPSCTRNELIAKVYENLLIILNSYSIEKTIAEYKENSLVLNKDISFMKGQKKYLGHVLDINAKGNLVVLVNGKEMVLESGEISLGSQNFT